MSFFREIWILISKLKLPPDYVYSISPVERELYMAIYSDEKAKESNRGEVSSGDQMTIGDPIVPY